MNGASTGDGYVRLGSTAPKSLLYGAPSRPGALLFVDLACQPDEVIQCLRSVRDLPYGYFMNVSTVLVRLPFRKEPHSTAPAALAELEALLTAIAPGVTSMGLIEHRFGAVPTIHGTGQLSTSAGSDRIDGLVHRARAAELSAIVSSNHALWSPRDYHFRLPGGNHVSSFIRIADGFGSIRDVEAMATWFLPDLRDRCGIVLDNRSLTALAIMLSRFFDVAAAQPGPITFLEHFPDSQLDVEAAVRQAAAGGAGVLGILSVSNAGRTRDGMLAALDRAGQPAWHLHVLVDRAARGDSVSELTCSDEVSTWLGLGDGGDRDFSPETCPMCVTQERRRVVGIDPRFFDGMVLPDPTLVMLSPTAAQAASTFWEACDEAAAVALEHRSTPETQARRRQPEDKSGRMGVFISMERLYESDSFRSRVRAAAAALRATTGAPDGVAGPFDEIDLVVISKAEMQDDDPAQDAFTQTVREAIGSLGCGTAPIVVVDHTTDPSTWDALGIEAIKASTHLLIVGGGTVTGYSMQKLLVGCQEHLRSSVNPQALSGLLLNARLATAREWQTLCNSYARRLYALFDTLLPTQSPLRQEASTISAMRSALVGLDEHWRPRIESFLDERAELCNGSNGHIDVNHEAPYQPVLWGLPPSDQPRAHIRQHSLFGHKLGPASFFSAVGSAVHREREKRAAEPGPVWHLFEMAALVRSYYDVLLIASMLRWMSPSEIWWGNSASSCILELIERSTVEDRAVLIPELLLAAAHGKLPPDAARILEEQAVQLLTAPPDGFREDEVVALAAGLLAWRTDQAMRGRLASAGGSGGSDPVPAYPF